MLCCGADGAATERAHQPLKRRGWFGIRRKASDVYEDYESDDRDQTGHRNSETRRNAYQEREREEIRAKSAETRRHVRAVAFGAGSNRKGRTRSLRLNLEEMGLHSCPVARG